ncbi:hypothetical protein RHMOL_Rhmol04G0147700 [Rhododendron molle]|uniref:Uncharacterized protein n=1 Tax=Rhododendron molle TaxID=49168 RepID=A0ACC0P227_RHOML|nr:hypothetical protein RHMOL_Rhmol04G0147700 [Rhododendron molle]
MSKKSSSKRMFMSEIRAKWKALGDKAKQKYIEKAKLSSEAYKEQKVKVDPQEDSKISFPLVYVGLHLVSYNGEMKRLGTGYIGLIKAVLEREQLCNLGISYATRSDFMSLRKNGWVVGEFSVASYGCATALLLLQLTVISWQQLVLSLAVMVAADYYAPCLLLLSDQMASCYGVVLMADMLLRLPAVLL